MIKVSMVDKTYLKCQSCEGAEKVKNISIGLDGGSSSSSFRLCDTCFSEMVEKSKDVQ